MLYVSLTVLEKQRSALCSIVG
uniref:Uncharacterized protein n=1 Tax=Rhizophora mucronata TaxID=61149 RepID=A0A2P2NGI6_RHIMU